MTLREIRSNCGKLQDQTLHARLLDSSELFSDFSWVTLVFYRCDLKVAEMIVCRKDEFIRRAVPSALPYEAWREGNDSSWNPPTTYPAIERSASEPRGDGAAASIKAARGQG